MTITVEALILAALATLGTLTLAAADATLTRQEKQENRTPQDKEGEQQ